MFVIALQRIFDMRSITNIYYLLFSQNTKKGEISSKI